MVRLEFGKLWLLMFDQEIVLASFPQNFVCTLSILFPIGSPRPITTNIFK